MAKPKAAPFEPSKCFELHDIALWTSALERPGKYQPDLHNGKTEVQTMRSATAEAFSAVLEGDEAPSNFVRVFVTFGVRSVYRPEGAEPEVLYSLEATFAVDNIVVAVPSQEDFEAYLSKNCPHLAWSFWRQHVYDTLKRASLPAPVIPLLASMRGGKRRKRIRKILGEEQGATPSE